MSKKTTQQVKLRFFQYPAGKTKKQLFQLKKLSQLILAQVLM